MVKVGDFWVDRYEAHIVNADAYNNGTCDGTVGTPTAYGEGGDDFPGTFPDNGNVPSPVDKLYACSVEVAPFTLDAAATARRWPSVQGDSVLTS